MTMTKFKVGDKVEFDGAVCNGSVESLYDYPYLDEYSEHIEVFQGKVEWTDEECFVVSVSHNSCHYTYVFYHQPPNPHFPRLVNPEPEVSFPCLSDLSERVNSSAMPGAESWALSVFEPVVKRRLREWPMVDGRPARLTVKSQADGNEFIIRPVFE